MKAKEYQRKMIRQFQTQEQLLADLYEIFSRSFPGDRDFWNRLVREEEMHARLIGQLYAVVEKGQMVFDEGKVKTYTLTAMIERIEALVKRARGKDFDRREALAQAMDLESALIEKAVFTHFEPVTDQARAILKRLNSETLDHLNRVRRMHAGARLSREPADGAKDASPLQWTPALSVGVEEIDAQHQTLFDLVNRAAALQARGGRVEAASDLIREMLRYSDEHFRAEDALMIDSAFPLFGTHRREHLKYMQKLGVLVAGLKAQRPGLITEVLDFLTVWWYQHIIESDRRYARWIENGDTGRP